jgi:chloramphenicol-sensitive protein RarD
LNRPQHSDQANARLGTLAGLLAYAFWGVFPVYFKVVGDVLPFEVLAHRVIWAVPFGALILFFRHQFGQVRVTFGDNRTMLWLVLAALAISANWFVYIWAVQNERIFEASLGYYINPLVYVLVGVCFLGERLRRLQLWAVVVAGTGVGILTVQGGELPWVSLSLAGLFATYGVIRKQIAVGAMPGLFIETLLLFPFAIGWLAWLMLAGKASFASGDTTLNAWLLLAGPFTVLPLLFFATAARNLTLAALGFMQFIAPTLQFLTGLYYGEPLTRAHAGCFLLIWIAVLLFSIDAYRSSKKKSLPTLPTGT